MLCQLRFESGDGGKLSPAFEPKGLRQGPHPSRSEGDAGVPKRNGPQVATGRTGKNWRTGRDCLRPCQCALRGDWTCSRSSLLRSNPGPAAMVLIPPGPRATRASQNQTARRILQAVRENRNGPGGIRTLGTLLKYAPLAKVCFRPLSHRSMETRVARRLNTAADSRQPSRRGILTKSGKA